MARMLPWRASLALFLGLGLLAGCGSGDDDSATPEACLGGADAFVDALADAPDEVLVDGTPLGECLADDQEIGQIAEVGEGLVAAATELGRRARRDPLGEPTVQLGYLVGTVEARAETTGGIHEDLALRVESAALFLPEDEILPGGFAQRYEEGLAAGRENASS